MTLAYVDPFSGASGDMLLGALVDAGASLDAVRAVLAGLGLRGWSLDAHEVTRGGIAALHVVVDTREQEVVRTWANVRALLSRASLPDDVRARALGTFSRLAAVEARIHRRDVEQVHFHEVGGLDAIVDIVGVCAAFHVLGVTSVVSGPVAQGVGMARAEHGLLPVPAPAVLELLVGAPTYSTGVAAELCTPTGAALLAEWVARWEAMPAMVVGRVGYGAGTRDLDRPNVVRVVLGEAVDGPRPEPLVLLETTIDDLSGELLPPVLDALRRAGAADAWARPVLMKKGRPGLEIACLAPRASAEALRRVLFNETTTLGVRAHGVERWALERRFETVHVRGVAVRLKIGVLDGDVVNVAPEFEDCAAAAAATGLPLKEVYARARAAWQAPPPPGAGPPEPAS